MTSIRSSVQVWDLSGMMLNPIRERRWEFLRSRGITVKVGSLFGLNVLLNHVDMITGSR